MILLWSLVSIAKIADDRVGENGPPSFEAAAKQKRSIEISELFQPIRRDTLIRFWSNCPIIADARALVADPWRME